jgi:NAD(P)-dependent dehydrogenase (short-subunit alcohol dehydrogenase family)
MVSNRFFAIVAGVGPGTGRSVAVRFSESYPVVLLARRPESYNDVVAQINKAGGKAIGISADATDESSLASAFESIKKEFENLQLVAAIYNVRPNSRPSRKPFLELNLEDLDISLNGNVYVLPHRKPLHSSWCVSNGASYSSRGLFNFAQSTLPLLLESVDSSPQPPTLIVTGATASIRGSKLWSVIAAGKSAGRILTQSLAREFGPAGVHVAHAIIDGGIDVPDAEHAAHNDGTPDGKISPYAVSDPGHLL